jgi:hypothetical protein
MRIHLEQCEDLLMVEVLHGLRIHAAATHVETDDSHLHCMLWITHAMMFIAHSAAPSYPYY